MPLAAAPRASARRVLLGSATFLLFAVNTVVLSTLLYLVTVAKLVVPVPAFRRAASRLIVWIAERWIQINSWGLAVTQPTRWDVSGLEGLSRQASYLVVSNHRSWVDIPVLQRIFLGHAPFLRFFLKKELIWVPVLGGVWWALDYPFMKRHSKETLEKHPEKRGEDLETTRRACEKFRHVPVSVLNFLEGTRFTAAKHARNGGSPFRNLLVPKSGGLAFAASALGDRIRSLVDVTIVYPGGSPTFWDLISGGVPRIVARVKEVEIPRDWSTGDYLEDAAFRERFQAFVKDLWTEKDRVIEELLAETAAA